MGALRYTRYSQAHKKKDVAACQRSSTLRMSHILRSYCQHVSYCLLRGGKALVTILCRWKKDNEPSSHRLACPHLSNNPRLVLLLPLAFFPLQTILSAFITSSCDANPELRVKQEDGGLSTRTTNDTRCSRPSIPLKTHLEQIYSIACDSSTGHLLGDRQAPDEVRVVHLYRLLTQILYSEMFERVNLELEKSLAT